MNGPLTIGDILILGTIVGAALTVWRWIELAIKKSEERQNKKSDLTQAELNNFKLKIAEEYASRDMLLRLESRLIDAINRLGDRLDKVKDVSCA